eukprot:TRINITY_DN5049_c0_g2_i1.p1 TRINITY_DN5049_c0_g2~~TRINITY_DN5049_c0_g2_i1.p1  ORF type:complete len:134 (+),score=56.54 TRINITY_DN5049_c0_g2_i1:32-403(+)
MAGGIRPVDNDAIHTVREQMQSPEMMKLLADMMKHMSPEEIAKMGQQMGFNFTPKQAEQAKAAMDKLGPEKMHMLMSWAGKLSALFERGRLYMRMLLQQPLLILALVMLLLAVIMHRLGWIGS